jgi:hypothetical protein
MSDLHWTCPKCGQIYRIEEPRCPVCFITREHRESVGKATTEKPAAKPAEDVEVQFPVVIKEARFNVPAPTGAAVWTSGVVLAIDTGIALLSEQDALDPQKVAAQRPTWGGRLGDLSFFHPPKTIARIVHQKLIGFFIETPDKKKIPLRLPTEGWEELDVVCDRLGIAHQ